LRRHVLDSLVIRPAEHRRAVAARQTPCGAFSGQRSEMGDTHHPKPDAAVPGVREARAAGG
jgi:hypothetical protein